MTYFGRIRRVSFNHVKLKKEDKNLDTLSYSYTESLLLSNGGIHVQVLPFGKDFGDFSLNLILLLFLLDLLTDTTIIRRTEGLFLSSKRTTSRPSTPSSKYRKCKPLDLNSSEVSVFIFDKRFVLTTCSVRGTGGLQ